MVLAALALALGAALMLAPEWSATVAKIEAAGRKVKVEHLVKTWAWRGLALDLVLVLVLLGTVRFWAGCILKWPGWPAPSRRFWVLLASGLLLALVIRAPRLDLSFYNDEAHNFVRIFAGDYVRNLDQPENAAWKPVSWLNTVWYNFSGNNSQPFSIAARLCYSAWARLAGAAGGEVSEAAVRLPSLVFGLASLLVVTLGVREMAGERAALWALVAGVLHGAHLRYSTEARGYSLMILAVALAFWFLHRAFESGRWRHWLGFGFSAFLCVWSFTGSAYFLASLSVLLMLRQLLLWRAGVHEGGQVIRPVVAGVCALLPALPLMLPLVPQLVFVLENFGALKGDMGLGWWRDVTSFLAFGCRWSDLVPENPANLALARVLAAQPILWAGAGALCMTMVIGAGALARRGGAAALMVLSSGLAMLLGWWLMSRKGHILHHWYVLYSLPCVLAMTGAGLAAVGGFLERSIAPQILARSAAGLLAVLVLWLPARISRETRALAKQDERAPVLAIRGAIYPHYLGTEGERALYGGFWCNSGTYDPRMAIVSQSAILEKLIARARAESRPLYISFSHRNLALQQSGDLVRRVEDSGDFERAGIFHGQEEDQFTQHLWRLRASGGGAAR